MLYLYVGLYRLQNINARAAAEPGGGWSVPPSFVGVRAADDGDVYATLRRLDASHVASSRYRIADRRVKCLVLDFSTTAALNTILRQVNRPQPLLSSSYIPLSARLRKVRRVES